MGIDAAAMKEALHGGLQAVIDAEPDITRYDTVVGDGDCGIGLRRGAEGIIAHLKKLPLTGDAVVDLSRIVSVVELEMDGTSGAIYSIFLNALLAGLKESGPGEASVEVWTRALKQSCEALSRYTPARPGDRTLV